MGNSQKSSGAETNLRRLIGWLRRSWILIIVIAGLGTLLIRTLFVGPSVATSYEIAMDRPAPAIPPCETRVYDEEGHSYLRIDYLIVRYQGKAPLYFLEPQQLQLTRNAAGCYEFPETVEPVQAAKGRPLFPVKVTVLSNKRDLRTYKGESIELTVTAEVQSDFVGLSWPLEITPGQVKEMKFGVSAPSFEIDNKDQTDSISLNKSASTHWTLFPKSTADGTQGVNFTISGEAFIAQQNATVTILGNRFDVEPLPAAIFLSLVGFVVFVISQWENIKKIHKDITKAMNKKKSSQSASSAFNETPQENFAVEKQIPVEKEKRSEITNQSAIGAIQVLGASLTLLAIFFGIVNWSLERKILVAGVVLFFLVLVKWFLVRRNQKQGRKNPLRWILLLYARIQRQARPWLRGILRRSSILPSVDLGLSALLVVVLLTIGWSSLEKRFAGFINPPVPRSDKLYFAFLVDASSRMADLFDGDRTKWDAVREAALDNLIFGLPSRANYGLILLGGNTSGETSNCEQVEMAYSFKPDSRGSIETLIQSQQPQGVTSLAKAIDLARDQLLKLSDDESTVKDVELFVFLGGGDGCLNDDYRPLLFFLQNSARFLAQTHVDIFILSKEPIDPAIEEAIKESDQETDAVRVNFTRNQPELETAVEQSSLAVKERAREVEPTAVAFQETVVVQQMTSTRAAVTDVPPDTAVPATNTRTPAVINFTPSSSPTVTASVTLTLPPLPTQAPPTAIPPTQIPPTELPPTQVPPTSIPPTAIPQLTFTPSPSVVLLSADYLGTGESCSARINLRVEGSPATGNFHVWNSFFGPEGDVYTQMTLPVGPNSYEVGLGGHGDPAFYRHKVWFEYNGTSSNVLSDLVCPGLTPSP